MRSWRYLRALRVSAMSALLTLTLPAQPPDAIDAFRHGRYAEARQILEHSPNPDRAFLALARAATNACDLARPDLAREFTANPDATVRRLTGIVLIQCDLARNRTADALPVLAQLEKSFPGDADVLYESAKVHMKAWNDAIFQMHQKTPASYRVDQLSGEIFEIQGRYADAAGEYRKAIAKNPAALNLHFRLGRALLLQSHDPANLRDAHKEFEAELALNPSDPVAEYEIGQILQAEQNPAAATHFEKAAALDPAFAEPLVALAKSRKPADAVPLLERAVKIQPASESAHYALMMAYRNAGRAEDARREKAVFDQLTRPPEGEFTDFLKRLGDKPKQ